MEDIARSKIGFASKNLVFVVHFFGVLKFSQKKSWKKNRPIDH